jgi:capsular polysaccharide export protein
MMRSAAIEVGYGCAGVRRLPKQVFAHGFSYRKRAIVRRFVGDVEVYFISNVRRLRPDSALLLWGSKPVPAGLAAGVRVIRIEDGFLRSVGLGADLIHPVSWVIDQCGIYYDATRPSDLECLLQHTEFDAALLARAASLRCRIVEHGLTKYNVGAGGWRRPPQGGRVILVPGQVETDASIRYGAPGIATNMGLLQAVKGINPEAHVVYKPHPDVVAGLRGQGQGEHDAARWCDEVVLDVAMSDMLMEVDEVHVLTSLAGFEALLRAKPVVCYGQPFYAGWGLTRDMVALPRRRRRLSLDALVAGALILYPTYVSRGKAGALCTAEQALDELLAWRACSVAAGGLPFWRKMLRGVLGIFGRRR